MKIAMIARLLAERRRLLAHEDWTRQQLEAFQVEACDTNKKGHSDCPFRASSGEHWWQCWSRHRPFWHINL